MIRIKLYPLVGDFGEDKDVAANLRDHKVKPHVENGENVVIDFEHVTLVTQSFIHALISDVLRINGEKALELLEFKNCISIVQGIISTVVQYSLDTLTDNGSNGEESVSEEERQQSFAFPDNARMGDT